MATAIAIIGGLGLFLLGMSVMTDGLKALAGSALRDVLARASATPFRGAFFGALVTMAVQSSSATTMTTIGLVSAGLLTFPQGLSLVFGANIGTTGTGWLVALLGVKYSLTAAAMPIVFVGAMLKLLRRGRLAATGETIAGFALILIGLTTLQQGMSGVAERLAPADLPGVIGGIGVPPWAGIRGLLSLVSIGLAMTTVMKSSSAAIAVTLSALHAGAVNADQAAALVIGQNIGSATSSMMAAIGANTPAKRTAVSHVLFNLVAGGVAVASFPFLAPLILWASARMDPTSLLATYHTTYNLVGAAILLPLLGPFSRLVEQLVPQRGPVFTRHLDRLVLTVPAVAVEAARRTVAGSLEALCASMLDSRDQAANGRRMRTAAHENLRTQIAEAMEGTRMFLSELAEPPASKEERRRLAATLHALDHTARLAEAVREDDDFRHPIRGVDGLRATTCFIEAIRTAATLAARTAVPPTRTAEDSEAASAVSEDLTRLATYSLELADLRRTHRHSTLESAASGTLTAAEAMARVEALRRADRLVYHAWRAAAYLSETKAAGADDDVPPSREVTDHVRQADESETGSSDRRDAHDSESRNT